MDLSKIPTPIAYALAIIIVALGLAGTYRVIQGSPIDIKTPFGDISVPGLDEDISMAEFIKQSEDTITQAHNQIKEQEQIIEDLQRKLGQAGTEVAKLTSAFDRLKQANSSQERNQANQALASSATQAKEYIQTAQTISIRQPVQTSEKLQQQVKLLNKVNLSSVNYKTKQ